MTFDHGDIAALALLNCSAAFDTVDHDILLRKLSESFGVDDTALQWLTSYLQGRLHAFDMVAVSRNIKLSTTLSHRDRSSDHSSSSSTQLNSARWSLLIICIHTNTLMMYSLLRNKRPPTESNALRDQLSSCVQDICLWKQSHRLHLNTSKTVLPFKASSAHTRRWLPCQYGPGKTCFCSLQFWSGFQMTSKRMYLR